ncbi:MAG: V-type ATP synthase subunit D [Chloroflexota bacterium]
MPRINVPLTRSSLLEAQAAVGNARQGFELLDRKREVLIAELVDTVEDAEVRRADLDRLLEEAYDALIQARMAMGVQRVRWAALAAPQDVEVRLTERSVMGAEIPNIDITAPPFQPRYSLSGTTADLDRATEAFGRLLVAVASVAETETAINRLSSEIKKTQRRVNALRTIVIPRYEAIIRAVREALEEGEREAFFRAKTQKRLAQRRAAEEGGGGR